MILLVSFWFGDSRNAATWWTGLSFWTWMVFNRFSHLVDCRYCAFSSAFALLVLNCFCSNICSRAIDCRIIYPKAVFVKGLPFLLLFFASRWTCFQLLHAKNSDNLRPFSIYTLGTSLNNVLTFYTTQLSWILNYITEKITGFEGKILHVLLYILLMICAFYIPSFYSVVGYSTISIQFTFLTYKLDFVVLLFFLLRFPRFGRKIYKINTMVWLCIFKPEILIVRGFSDCFLNECAGFSSPSGSSSWFGCTFDFSIFGLSVRPWLPVFSF